MTAPAFVRVSTNEWRHRTCGRHTDDPTSHRCPFKAEVAARKGEA